MLVDRVEVITILPEVEKIDVEGILLIPERLLLEQLGDLCYELLWVVLIEIHLLLHVPTYVHPLVQFHYVFVREVGHKRLYANRKRTKLQLPQDVIFIEAASEIADLFNLERELVEVLY